MAYEIPMICPHCQADLCAGAIPAEYVERGYYSAEQSTHFSRVIGVYDRNQDRTVSWECPDCHAVWSREGK